MALMHDVLAVNELVSSLEEESISEITLEDATLSFTLRPEGRSAVPLQLIVEDPKKYPSSPALVLSASDAELPWLDQLNAKLASGGRLSKAIRLLGAKLAMDLDWVEEADGGSGGSEQGSGSDQDEEMLDADGHSDDEDAELLREWSKCLTRWEAIERQAEQKAEEEERKGGSAGNLDAISNKQIFDTKAAFRRLVNEMEEVFKAQDYSLVAEAGGEGGLYTWNVSLAGFTPGSQLAQDMHQAGRKFGVSSVQLQLGFKRGLHPFYPPSVRLVAPRFQGPMLGVLSSHPMFTTARWDPMLSAREVLLSIKDFLEAHGRVDLAAERNRMSGPAGSAYLESEHLLARLEGLCQVPSLWRLEGDPMYSELEGQADRKPDSPRPTAAKKQKAEAGGVRKAEGKAVAWAAGTGYGYGTRGAAEVWDAKRAAAVQAARDAEARDVLSQLAAALSSQLAGEDAADCQAAVRRSCLALLLVHQLRAASFQDMAARHSYYLALLKCLEAVCNPLTAEVLSWRGGEGEPSVADVLGRVQLQASHYVRVCGGGGASGGGAAPSGGGRRGGGSQAASQGGAGPSTLTSPGQQLAAAAAEEEQRELELAQYLLKVAGKVQELAQQAQQAQQGGGGGAHAEAARPSTSAAGMVVTRSRGQQSAAAAAAAAAPAAAGGSGDLEGAATYRSQMSQYKVRILQRISDAHVCRDAASKESVQSKERLRRVGKELASCESDLPVHPHSSVFVVADEASTCLWKALIVGPKGTPYEGGCFIFDIYFPQDYPRVPPKVQLKTTGGSTVRFNPNLYNCGKVCLSLLGTWQGAKGESWDPAVSTILQVLVSIQSLIMVDDPFYNEPGYEQRANKAQSDAYSANIMEQTLRWAMIDQLRSPPPYFEDVITTHFRLRGDAILASCRRWAGWCREKGHPGHAGHIETMVGQLEKEISKLGS